MPELTRQFAAIMFTDIVGYTEPMGEEEEKAFALLERTKSGAEARCDFDSPISGKYEGYLSCFGRYKNPGRKCLFLF